MIIKSLRIQNFKSFGNNVNEFKFNQDKGELILLLGKNGHGKSSFSESLDFALFNKVKGKTKKTAKLSSLANRYNKNLNVGVDFTAFNTDITVERGSSLKVTENNIPIKTSGKGNVQTKLNTYLDFDFESWKSFISMSINDFKNFMTLKPEEKRLLLDRLFNLELINSVTKVLKDKKKLYKQDLNTFNVEISSYENSLSEFKQSIESLKKEAEKNTKSEIDNIKNLILDKKEPFKELSEKLKKYEQKDVEIKNDLKIKQEEFSKIKFQIEDTNKKIELYNQGKCHTCGSDLTTETFTSHKNEHNETLEKLNLLKEDVKNDGKLLSDKQNKLKSLIKDSNDTFLELRNYLKTLKSKLLELEEDSNEEDSSTISSLNESIKRIEDRQKESNDNLIEIKQKDSVLEQLLKIFSDDGIKKNIISKIVEPINHFIKENLEEMGMNFTIELDDQFSAKLYLLGEEIDSESLSTGELKISNICIMLAYLKLIRMRRHINVLFLDEVFASIDIENIILVLGLLKKFSNDYNINIFLVHHAMLDSTYFDRVVKIEKDITSNIYETKTD